MKRTEREAIERKGYVFVESQRRGILQVRVLSDSYAISERYVKKGVQTEFVVPYDEDSLQREIARICSNGNAPSMIAMVPWGIISSERREHAKELGEKFNSLASAPINRS